LAYGDLVKLVLWTIVVWSACTAGIAYWYIVVVSRWPNAGDAYARDLDFRLLAFLGTVFPVLVLVLVFVLLAERKWLRRRAR
jgi:hypothetical protein